MNLNLNTVLEDTTRENKNSNDNIILIATFLHSE